MVFIAIANGALREFTYGKKMSELKSHQLSSLTGTAVFFVYTYFLSIFVPINSIKTALTAGSIWLVLTIVFEFTFGRYVAGHSWEKLFSDYNLFKGRVWILVLLAIFLYPSIFFFVAPAIK